MQFTELKQHLSSDKLFPCYMIVGEDAFLRSAAADMFKTVVTAVPEINLNILNSPDADNIVLEAAESLPLMSEKRVVMVYDYMGDMSRIIKYLTSPNISTVLVFVMAALSANFNKAANIITPIDCSKLGNEMLGKWIAAKVKEHGASITKEAAELLIEYCAASLTRISGEVAKLASFKHGEIVESQDVRSLVTADIEVKIFELSDALGARNASRVAVVLDSLMAANTPIVNLMGLLYSHFRRLLYCRITPPYNEMSSALGVKDYAVKKAKEQAARFTSSRLKKICDSFHKADYDFKSGKINDRMALDLFVFTTMQA